MKKVLLTLFICFYNLASGQDVRVYHGQQSESVYLKPGDNAENSSKEPVAIVRASNGIVTINILNPNPFFYNYEIKTEDVDITDDYSDDFAELVKIIGNLPDLQNAKAAAARVVATKFSNYVNSMKALSEEITEVNTAIQNSDQPETIDEALRRISNPSGYGFRSVIATIRNQDSKGGHFNSKSLKKDLTDALEAAIADSSFDTGLGVAGNSALHNLYASAFRALNQQYISTVSEILKTAQKDLILRFQVPVKQDKKTTIKLVITKIKDEDTTVRELLNEDIAVIEPRYTRKRFEVVPVVNLIFQSNAQKYYVENKILKSSPDDEAKFNLGAMALMNIASFGDYKEYGVGIGIGYSLELEGKTNSIFILPSISYKNIVRIGVGFGFTSSPVGLKEGATVGMALPENISDIDDFIDYKRKTAAVISIAISGFKF